MSGRPSLLHLPLSVLAEEASMEGRAEELEALSKAKEIISGSTGGAVNQTSPS